MAADEIVDNDTLLALGGVFETDDDHAVALRAFAPAVGAIVFTDLAEFDEIQIAVCADVVVAGSGRHIACVSVE